MRAGSRQTSAVSSKTQLKKALTSGPLPRYNQLYYGVGVAITLKVDQGTGRTVNGFIQEVLTAGDHPRGVKVRLRDSRVGRVQFLTGLSFEAGAQTTKSSSSGLPSGFKNLSINEKYTPSRVSKSHFTEIQSISFKECFFHYWNGSSDSKVEESQPSASQKSH
ncbi:hypothetical protein BJ741DRAFT_539947 [Chytriomyces cf. hyalinus JEL632]|nr:hypothetical protein BJ741DRAFT_539947 [Chytriomyces cf. hyalinus JEL632]